MFSSRLTHICVAMVSGERRDRKYTLQKGFKGAQGGRGESLRGRERERETDRQTDRQRQRDRQTDREKETERGGRESEKKRGRRKR